MYKPNIVAFVKLPQAMYRVDPIKLPKAMYNLTALRRGYKIAEGYVRP